MPKRVEIIVPILSCSDLERSLEFYQGALGSADLPRVRANRRQLIEPRNFLNS